MSDQLGIWFLVGSVLSFFDSTVTAGTWLFVIGSAQLLIRPVIRLSRRVHLKKWQPQQGHETARDF